MDGDDSRVHGAREYGAKGAREYGANGARKYGAKKKTIEYLRVLIIPRKIKTYTLSQKKIHISCLIKYISYQIL